MSGFESRIDGRRLQNISQILRFLTAAVATSNYGGQLKSRQIEGFLEPWTWSTGWSELFIVIGSLCTTCRTGTVAQNIHNDDNENMSMSHHVPGLFFFWCLVNLAVLKVSSSIPELIYRIFSKLKHFLGVCGCDVVFLKWQQFWGLLNLFSQRLLRRCVSHEKSSIRRPWICMSLCPIRFFYFFFGFNLRAIAIKYFHTRA